MNDEFYFGDSLILGVVRYEMGYQIIDGIKDRRMGNRKGDGVPDRTDGVLERGGFQMGNQVLVRG